MPFPNVTMPSRKAAAPDQMTARPGFLTSDALSAKTRQSSAALKKNIMAGCGNPEIPKRQTKAVAMASPVPRRAERASNNVLPSRNAASSAASRNMTPTAAMTRSPEDIAPARETFGSRPVTNKAAAFRKGPRGAWLISGSGSGTGPRAAKMLSARGRAYCVVKPWPDAIWRAICAWSIASGT